MVLTASSHVTSPIHPPWGVAGQFYPAAGGEPSPVCDSRVGRATLCAVPRVTYWSESDRVSVSTNLRYSRQPAVICVYEGVRSVRIDWEQLYTGNCRQNADLQKVEQAVVKSVWCRLYGFVDAEQTDAAALRKDWDILCLTWELSPRSTLKNKAALCHVERCEKDGLRPFGEAQTNVHKTCSHTQNAPTHTPLPAIVYYEGKAFTKTGQGHCFPLWDHLH